ncbi:hypothetical protein SKAU_G00218430 [Synaphobranchus kaupii]|uniref:Uncharacterized protein n=1 Tax=Synaphobranchus kaupii TaxID=118154 RepID=A0A9Q1FAV6_SYNKA|nr:hypothetical protein SKAU_G00218430 [Synaphobranchus kaupii]
MYKESEKVITPRWGRCGRRCFVLEGREKPEGRGRIWRWRGTVGKRHYLDYTCQDLERAGEMEQSCPSVQWVGLDPEVPDVPNTATIPTHHLGYAHMEDVCSVTRDPFRVLKGTCISLWKNYTYTLRRLSLLNNDMRLRD